MSYATQARPYALAAYEVASGKGAVELWAQSLEVLRLVLSSDDLRRYIKDPTVSVEMKLCEVERICEGFFHEEFQRFVRELTYNRRLLAIDDVCLIFRQLHEERSSVVNASFTTAVDLSDEDKSKLVNVISKKIGFEMEPEFSVDPEIIGGLIVRFRGDVLDISLRNHLAQLKENLIL